MLENEIRELFDLSMRVIQETKAYVRFGVDSFGRATIAIQDKGYDANKKYDATYAITPEHELLSKKDYQWAKEHLERLLTEGKCPEGENNGQNDN